MPRSRSSRASRPAPSPVPVRHAPTAPPVQYQQQRPAGIGSTIAEGMAFGGGSAVAHRAVDAVMGPRTVTHEVVQSSTVAGGGQSMGQREEFDACANQTKAFKDCLSFNADDIGKCQFYVDMLNECRRSAGAGPQVPSWS